MIELPEQDIDAAQVHKPEEVLVVPPVAHHQAEGLLKPGKEPLHLIRTTTRDLE